MKVECEVADVMLKQESGRDVPGVCVTCSRCEHSTESFGRSDSSVRRCLALLREECPEDEKNFYVQEGEDDDDDDD